jgi:hypothetical protein
MSDEIKKFDPNDILKGIRNDLKAKFMNVIPDKEWDKLIKEEFKHFSTTNVDRYGNGQDSYVRREIRTIIQEELRRNVQSYLKTKAFDKVFKTELLAMVKNHLPEMISGVVLSAMNGHVTIYNQNG